QPVPAREPAELLKLLLAHLRDKSAERVAARRAAAEQELAVELARVDRYFESILQEQSDPESIETVTALAQRRRTEEVRRSQVKAVVHPLQLLEAALLVQRAEWQLESAPPRRRHATFAAQRPLSGAAAWIMACPHCGRPPAALVVCRHDHCSCEACSYRCSVCAEDFCADHGIAECRVDSQAACAAHRQVWPSGRLMHCPAPLRRPDRSRRLVCGQHRTACAHEPAAIFASDEVGACASCGKLVCAGHSAECVADKLRHCVAHLEPLVDANGSYGCSEHRKHCHVDGRAFSLKGVSECPICGEDACAGHRAACAYCGRRVCITDLGRATRRCATCAQLA